jgi:hypothetical protein
MFELNPESTDTLQSKGFRGRNIWLQILGEYPKGIKKLKTTDNKKWGEWRSVTGQTIIFGQHPESTRAKIIRYSCVSPKPVMQGPFDAIVWPNDLLLPWKKKEPEPRTTPATRSTQIWAPGLE